jgi:hypothetical protein
MIKKKKCLLAIAVLVFKSSQQRVLFNGPCTPSPQHGVSKLVCGNAIRKKLPEFEK